MLQNNISETKKAWEERSRKFGYKVEGVATKSLPPAINKQLDNWMLQKIESSVKSLPRGKKKLKVLDLGCGYGRLSKPLLEKYPDLKTYGVDISKNYVDLYNRDLNPRGRAIEGDIKKMPFKDNFFDTVFIVTTLMYLTAKEERKKALTEIIRVCKPGGKVIFIERSPSGYFLFTIGGLANFIRGKKNKEILAVSIEKKSLIEMIRKSGGKLQSVSGIPFLSLFMPASVLLHKINPGIVNFFLRPVNSLDKKLNQFLWPSLYLSYTVIKSPLRK